jgi:hypothetical protein
MFLCDRWPWHPEDSAEAFIGDNLSIYQSQWLYRQSEALGQPRTIILENILKEWSSSNSADVPDEPNAVETAAIARRAVSEFILRHHEEFLP